MNMPIPTQGTTTAVLQPHARNYRGRRSATGGALPSQARDAALVIDAESHIVRCSQSVADLMGKTVEALTNRPVKEIFPRLPMTAKTPGYNLAYAAIHGAQGGWMRHFGRPTNGALIPLEISFTCMKVDKKFQIAINIRSGQSLPLIPYHEPDHTSTQTVH